MQKGESGLFSPFCTKEDIMPNFDITITRTGSIVVEAPTEQEAFERYAHMTAVQIEECAQLTGWEASDAVQIDN